MDHEEHRRHHKKTKILVVIVFILLALGELFLYRKVMELNKMVSEGFMQVKESQRPTATVTPTTTK